MPSYLSFNLTWWKAGATTPLPLKVVRYARQWQGPKAFSVTMPVRKVSPDISLAYLLDALFSFSNVCVVFLASCGKGRLYS